MEEDALLIPAGMTNDCIAQTWYRFLRTIGSPIALCSPQVISKTPQFMQWVVSRAAEGVEAINHPCLLQLPLIFLKAIKGISSQVDAFLGTNAPIQGFCILSPFAQKANYVSFFGIKRVTNDSSFSFFFEIFLKKHKNSKMAPTHALKRI